MKVILLQELKGKGGEGDVVDVAPGFANNYLMPQGIAILATKGNLKQLEMRKNNIAKREATRLADADKLKSVLDGASVKVDAKVGEEGQLFGSVTATQIAEAIKEALGGDMNAMEIPGSGWTVFSGILLVLCSLWILFQPLVFGTTAVVIWVGISLLFAGIAACSLSIQLRRAHQCLGNR